MAHNSPGQCEPAQPPVECVWQAKYIKVRQDYRAAKATIRQQAERSRQLIVVVADQLQKKDEELKQLRDNHDRDLSAICQQLFLVRACLVREKERLQGKVQEKDLVIQQQRNELEKIRGSGFHRSGSGSIRHHGSFRQFKKEKSRSRNYNSSSESNLSSSTCWTASSEESSASSPRQTRPPLRLTLSSGSIEPITSETRESRPVKGILKTSSSYVNLSSSSSCLTPSKTPDINPDVIANLQNLIRSKNIDNGLSPSIVKSLLVDNVDIKKEEKSDSGRESEDQSVDTKNVDVDKSFCRMSSISSYSSSSGIVTDSPNSSFDASDPTRKVVIEIRGKSKPPTPPPRSSSTRLSSTRQLSAGDALDSLIYEKRIVDGQKCDDSSVTVHDGGVSVNKDRVITPIYNNVMSLESTSPRNSEKTLPKPCIVISPRTSTPIAKSVQARQVASTGSSVTFSGSDVTRQTLTHKPGKPTHLKKVKFHPSLEAQPTVNNSPHLQTSNENRGGISYFEPYL